MYSVIIADDERRICALLEKSIHWQELGLELAGICTNGTAMLEAVGEKRPDILITDIQMPGINGIDAIRRIRESGNDCKIIIISGYQEFAYAHNALKYNVNDYLLKPIDAEELNASLKKSILELDSAADNLADAAGGEALREHFLATFLPAAVEQGNVRLDAVNEKYATRFRPGCFRGMYLYVDTGMNGHEVGDLDPILRKMRDICASLLEPVSHELLFSVYGDGLLLGVNYAEESWSDELLQKLFKRANSVIELFSNTELTVGVGKAGVGLDGLRESLEQAMRVVRYRSAVGSSRVIFYESFCGEYDFSRINRELAGYITGIRSSFEACRRDSFREAYDEFLSGPDGGRPFVRLLYIEKVADAFCAYADENFPKHERAEAVRRDVQFELQHAQSIPVLWEKIRTMISDALDVFDRQLKERENLPIRQAKDYIYKNYQKQIHLEDIAAYVYLSPSYLSNTFKKVTGENIVNFINGYRISQAKNLLVSTNMTVEEIANAVGFETCRYFGNVFKKTVGINPTEYRKLYN